MHIHSPLKYTSEFSKAVPYLQYDNLNSLLLVVVLVFYIIRYDDGGEKNNNNDNKYILLLFSSLFISYLVFTTLITIFSKHMFKPCWFKV